MPEDEPSTTDRWRRADRVLAAVFDAEPADRERILADACGDDTELRAEVERLLAADARNDGFLERPAPSPDTDGMDATDAASDESGLVLGPYRLLRRVGQGGMGAVYLAERTDGQFERQVAIKLMREGIDEPEAVARFHRERQSLARLQHAGIARLHDGGRTDDGRPYLVMDYVEGVSIDRFCVRESLSVEGRLRLFQQVCAAVQHAHGHLVVHRDLKPANILVTAEGEARLLDFGIAKRLSPEGEDTRTEARAMTPHYASPEQVRGDTITTASDVYALGVLLYELLCGRLPYRLDNASTFEIGRAVIEQQPVAPSVAAADSVRRRRLRGDLDAIVLKALRKEPEQRYASVALLAQDIEQYLTGQPVTARRGSLAYATRRFVRRNRAAVTAATLVLAALLGLVARLVAQSGRLVRERDKAEQALEFLVTTFAQADPYAGGGETETARDVLDRGAARVTEGIGLAADVQGPLLAAIGRSYLGLGLVAQGVPLIERAAAVSGPDGRPAIANDAVRIELLAEARTRQGRFEEAESLWRRAAALRESAGDPGKTVPALLGLGGVLEARERLDEAEQLHQQALEISRRLQGPGHPQVAEALRALAHLRNRRGLFEQAVTLHEQALAVERQAFGPESAQVARGLGQLADAQSSAGQPQRAESVLREALAIQERRLGEAHPDTAATLHSLATALHYQSRLPEAEALYRLSLARLRSRLGPRHPRVADALLRLGAVVQMRDRYDEAVTLLEEALAVRQEVFGRRSEPVAEALTHLARSRFYREPEQALELEGEALDIVAELFGEVHPSVAASLLDTGQMLLKIGKAAEAEPYLRQSLLAREQIFAAHHLERSIAQAELAGCLTALGRHAEAEAQVVPAFASLSEHYGPTHAYTKHVRRRARELYEAWGRPDRASEYGPTRAPLDPPFARR